MIVEKGCIQKEITDQKEKYRQWKTTMLDKFENDDSVFLLLGKKAFPLTADHVFTNPINYMGFDFYCVEVAYKFGKYYNESTDNFGETLNFLDACLKSTAKGSLIRTLENTLKKDTKPIEIWSKNEEYKFGFMKSLMIQKFENNPELAKLLLATESKEIIAPSFKFSGNGLKWSDQLYEIEYDENGNKLGGKNIHGEILMEIRNSFNHI